VIEQGMFVKHCKVEVYLLEIKMCENSNLEKIINNSMSRADTIGKALLIVFVHVTYMYL
jgi:ubiquitin carboxyl-terminal hydrolase 4/11/15